MVLSVLVALVLTPALCATPAEAGRKGEPRRRARLLRLVQPHLRPRPWPAMSAALRRHRRPSAAGPGRLRPDRRPHGGAVHPPAHRLPAGGGPGRDHDPVHPAHRRHPVARPWRSRKQVEALLPGRREGQRRQACSRSPASASPAPARTSGMAFLHLQRLEEPRRAAATAPRPSPQRAMRGFRRIRDAQVFALVPPAVQELGNSSGFDLELEDRGGLGHAALVARAQPAAGHGRQGPDAGRRCGPTARTTRRSCTSTSTRRAPGRWA